MELFGRAVVTIRISMAFLDDDKIDQFEEEYFKLIKEELKIQEGEPEVLTRRKMELGNTMEYARRVFLHFAETGEVKLSALDNKC